MNKRVLHWESRIGRRLRLRDLHILFAVAQYGSMAKAAKHLGISQPSISEAIADLENTVGVRLLDRSPQGASTTIYGEALLRRGRAAFDEMRQGIRDIEFLADPTVGELRIASPETLTAGFLPAVIERMSRKYPGIVFHVVQANTVTLEFRELRERSVDLALARLTQPLASDDLHAETLFNDQLYVVAGARHRLARRRKISGAELAAERWIAIPPDNVAGSFAAEAFRASGLGLPRPTVVTFSQNLRYHLLAGGRYLTTLAGSTLQFNAAYFSLKVLPVKLNFPSRPVVVVTLRNRSPSPLAKIFVEHAHAVAKSMTVQ
jgi:DNA-binding transcriptional LysR family regulator